MSSRKPTLCLVNNIPTPYRRELFDQISEKASESGMVFSTLYLAQKETCRDWQVEIRPYEKVLPILWQRRNKKTTTSDLIINYGFAKEVLRPSQVILFGYNYPTYLFILVLRKFFGRRTDLFCETTLFDCSTLPWKRSLKAFILRTFFRQFLVPGKRSAEYLLAHGVQAQDIFFARNASPLLPAQVQEPQDEAVLRLLFVGRLAVEKRILSFTRAFSTLEVNHHLTIVGDGPDFGPISKIADDNENIHSLGALEPEKLSEVYAQHNVLVLVSESEPWGLVVNEALNHGLALLLSPQVGSAPELLDANGVCLASLSSIAISEALDEIVSSLKAFRVRSREIAKETTIEAQATAFLDFAKHSDEAVG